MCGRATGGFFSAQRRTQEDRPVGVVPKLNGFLTPTQAGALLGVTRERARRLARAGKLPAVETPHGLLLELDAVRARAAQRPPAPDAQREE
jgi:hypothetical protein